MEEFKLRDSIGIYLYNSYITLTKSNTRDSIVIKNDNINKIYNILYAFKNWNTVENISELFGINKNDIINLVNCLLKNSFFTQIRSYADFSDYSIYRRVIHFLEDFSCNEETLSYMWNNIRNAKVLIIGLGGVGSWVSMNLIQSGVVNIYLLDDDLINISNLHRQLGFFEEDIGKYKVDIVEKRLKEKNPNLNITKFRKKILSIDSIKELNLPNIDLIINCADYPSVEYLSGIVGKFCTNKRIPHIIGGGYNLHTSLIGQTILPGIGPCFKCFNTYYNKKFSKYNNIRKINPQARKIGSTVSSCSIIASFIGMESIKVLTKYIKPSNLNRRGEFNIKTNTITFEEDIVKDPCCTWCSGLI